MDNDALRRALRDEDDGAWIAGEDMVKEADTPIADAVDDRENSSIAMIRELSRIKDPKERKRYMQDMAARNHRLAMDRPSSVRGAVATQKTASAFDLGVEDKLRGR